MLLPDEPVVDVRPLLADERPVWSFDCDRSAPAVEGGFNAPGLDGQRHRPALARDDLGRLSRDRDGDTSGLISPSSYRDLVHALNAKNQRWVDAAAGLSRDVVVDLLEWSGQQIDTWLAAVNLGADATVAWASDTTVPMWFDLARELTERWVHHQQLLDAIGQRDEHLDAIAEVVMDTFAWAYPRQYRAEALTGTTVRLQLGPRSWTLTRRSTGWQLGPGLGGHPDAQLILSFDQAWRILTGGRIELAAITRHGPGHVLEPLLAVRAAIV